MAINLKNIELKPCPFCREVPEFKKTYSGMGSSSEYIYIQCPSCGIKTKEFFIWYHTEDEIQPLITMWNTRL